MKDLKMKKAIGFLLAPAVLFTLAALALVGDSASAQTVSQPRPVGSPTPAPRPTAAPTVSPTPNLDEEEVYRVETEEVNLNVRVVDRSNRPVNNLAQAEFKVYEDNVLQPITSFTTAEVPTNYALVIDNSGSLRFQLDKVIEAGKIIVGTNLPKDESSVVRFVSSDKIEVVQEFTADKSLVNEALDSLFIEGGPTAIIDAVYLAAERVEQHNRPRRGNDVKRRALILISDGEDRDSYYKEEQLFQLLRESEVQIYAVGFINDLSKEGGFIGKSPQGKAKAFLERLATETGGRAFFPNSTNELPQIAGQIARELRTQYLITYSPTNETKEASFRNIRVVVNDGANKEKRIAITRTGRAAAANEKGVPTLQNQSQRP